MSKKRATLDSASSAATVSAPARRASQPGPLEERVQDLAGGPLVGQLDVPPEVRDQRAAPRPRPREAQDPGLAPELVQDLEHGPVPAARGLDDGRQVLAAEAVLLRCRDPVNVDARREVRDRAEERQQHPDLRPRVQTGRPGEAPRNARDVERPQDRVRGRVRPDQDRGVAGPGAAVDASRDVRGDPVRLVGAGGERLVADGRCAPEPRSGTICLTMPARTSSRSGSLWRMSR